MFKIAAIFIFFADYLGLCGRTSLLAPSAKAIQEYPSILSAVVGISKI